MKGGHDEGNKKDSVFIDLNATVNEIDEPRGFATP